MLLLRQEESIINEDVTIPRVSSPSPLSQNGQQYLQCQRGLVNLHRETGIPPTIKVLNGEVVRVSELAVAGGTYSDIWVGEWLGEEKVGRSDWSYFSLQVQLRFLGCTQSAAKYQSV